MVCLQVQTSDGRVYYFHPTTKESTWEKPRDLQSEVEKANDTEWKVMDSFGEALFN